MTKISIVCTPFSAKGIERPTKFSKRELGRISIFLGVAGKEEGDLFQGRLQFLHKKVYKERFSSVS